MSAPQNPAPSPTNIITNPPIGEFDAIYEAYNEALLREKYYANRLTLYRRVNKIYEIVLAIGTSTVIAGWAVFQANPGKAFWSVFSGVITVLVILKPLLQISKDIEDYTNLRTGYRALVVNLRSIVTKIKRQAGLTMQTIELFDATQKQYEGLSLKEDVTPKPKILAKCKIEVAQDIPPGSLWYPLTPQASQQPPVP